jgi:hypothetical protein
MKLTDLSASSMTEVPRLDESIRENVKLKRRFSDFD